ncbi:MAG: hypothetical protein NC301_03095 [Bacteroides sp.]|nr:hypothetical protein [Bacteroides sp.]MCM1378981.1 hypothetical protein [Bacteroides sp.]MCM1445597.1 hypothetical protein [Prevotella sp.]
MNKPFFRCLAFVSLLGASLTASADKVFYQVPSESWLADGGYYVVGSVGTAGNWLTNNPICYTASINANNKGGTVSMTAKPNLDFEDSMIWKFKAADKVCSNTHTSHGGPHQSFQLLCAANNNLALTYSPGLTNNLSNNDTYFEYVPTEVSGLGTVFVNHTKWDGSRYVVFRCFNPSGSANYYSTPDDVWNGQYVGSDGSWSVMQRIYLVIDDENLAATASVIWQALAEDDIATNGSEYTGGHITALRLRAVPDLAGQSASTLIDYLTQKYAESIEDIDFLTSTFGGKYLQIHHDVVISGNTRTGAIGIKDGALKVLSGSPKLTSTWYAEYDEAEDAIRLSIDGWYLGAIAPQQNTELSLATNASEAGLYRFYPQYNNNYEVDYYLLTCKRYSDGTEPAAWRTGAAVTANNNQGVDGETNNWVNDKVSTYNTDGVLSRWGSGAATAHWQISVVGETEAEALVAIAKDELMPVSPNINTRMLQNLTDYACNMSGVGSAFIQKGQAIQQLAQRLTVTPDANKFYYVVSAVGYNSGLKGLTIATEDDAVKVKWNSLASDFTSVWAITPTDQENSYLLRNAINGMYVEPRTDTGNNALYALQKESSPVTLTRINDSDCQMLIKAEGSFHCLNHSSGEGSNGSIIAYNNQDNINEPSAWYIIELSASEVEALQRAYSEVAAADGIPEWAQNNLENLFNVINDNTATASARIDAHLAVSDFNPSSIFADKLFKIESYGRPGFYIGFGGATSGWMHFYDSTACSDQSDFLFYFDAEHKLHHLLGGNAVNAGLQIDTDANAGALSLAFSPLEDGYKIIGNSNGTIWAHDMGTSNANYVNVVGRCGGTIEPTGHTENHAFKLILATEEEISQLIRNVAGEEPTLEGSGFVEGTEPGQLVVLEDATNWNDFCGQHGLNASFFNIDKYHDFLNAATNNYLLNKYTVAPVKGDRYFRVKASARNMESQNRSTEERYLSDQNLSDRSSFETSDNEHTLFYYSPEKYLISANNGRYVTLTGANRVINHSDALTADKTNGSHTWEFKAAVVSELGAYELMIKNNSNTTRSMHLVANATGGGADACDSHDNNDLKHNFYLVTAYELPVAVGENGYGSIVAPVALELPVVDDFYFYTFEYAVNGQEKNFRFQEIEAPATVEANTPILVKGLAGQAINLGINYDYTAPTSVRARVAEEEAPLIVAHASHIASAHAANAEATETYNTYALSSTEVGLLAGDVVFTPIAEGDELVAGTMHLTMPEKINEYLGGQEIVNTNGHAVLNLTSNYTTGIREVVSGEWQSEEVVYDLQGRRLNAPIRGINIINGRKALVK